MNQINYESASLRRQLSSAVENFGNYAIKTSASNLDYIGVDS
jgi:hypothetical protein